MTSPREQAIEAAAEAAYAHYTTGGALEKSAPCIRRDWAEIANAAIDTYLAARARIDGAKMMPREATALPLEVVLSEENDALIAENKRLKRELDDAQARLATEIDRAMETARQADRMREERLRKRYGE